MGVVSGAILYVELSSVIEVGTGTNLFGKWIQQMLSLNLSNFPFWLFNLLIQFDGVTLEFLTLFFFFCHMSQVMSAVLITAYNFKPLD